MDRASVSDEVQSDIVTHTGIMTWTWTYFVLQSWKLLVLVECLNRGIQRSAAAGGISSSVQWVCVWNQ